MSTGPSTSHISLSKHSRSLPTADDAKDVTNNHGGILYPAIETTIAPLDESSHYFELVKIEKDLVAYIKDSVLNGNPLEDVGDCSILPNELLLSATAKMNKKNLKAKLDPVKRLKELNVNNEELDEEEEAEDEEEEDEEQQVVEDEEDDAGGDYIVSHFDNGEGFDDNDDDGDEMTSMM